MMRRPKSMPDAVLAIVLCVPATAAERLPALDATPGRVSVSGVSAWAP